MPKRDESRATWDDSDVIVLGFTPYENEDEWDACIASKRLRELAFSPKVASRTRSSERPLD